MDWWRDARFGLQTLARSPGFTVASVLTLALGIGAAGAVFSVVSGTMIDPLPWQHARRLVFLSEIREHQPDLRYWVAPAKYRDWREQLQSVEDMAAMRGWGFNLTDGESDFVAGAIATWNIFDTVGIRPLLGRGFLPEDAVPGAPRVAVVTYGLWQRRYGGDPGIVGRTIDIDHEPATVVGVLPREIWFPWPWSEVLITRSLEGAELTRKGHEWAVVARTPPGASRDELAAEINTIASRLAAEYPETDAGYRIEVGDARKSVIPQPGPRRTLWILLASVLLVLLIACGNVANLLLARGAARQKEVAIRASLGAWRGRIVRQLLVESGVLALAAAPFALLVTYWSLAFFKSLAPPTVTYLDHFFRLDAPVLLFGFGLTCLTALVFGLAPALQSSRPDLVEALKEGGGKGTGGGGGQTLRATLAVVQIALATVLLVLSGLMIRSFVNIQSTDLGFRTEHLLTTSLALSNARFPEPEHWDGFRHDVTARLRALPGVENAAVVNNLPLGYGAYSVNYTIEGQIADSEAEDPNALWSNVGPEYFRTLGIRLLAGRGFEESDRGAAGVAIVNETLAKRHFPDGALGERLVLEERGVREIVGVVSDVKQFGFGAPTLGHIYEPFAQSPGSSMSILVRTRGDPEPLAGVIPREVRAIDPDQPIFEVRTMDSWAEESMWRPRFTVVLMSSLGGLALVLAAIGVYGVVSYATAQRTREFGIRAALGAEPSAIARLVLRRGAVLALLGLSIGLGLAALLGRGLAAVVHGVSPWDPATFAGIALLLALVALAASWAPARRATRVDPIVALRYE